MNHELEALHDFLKSTLHPEFEALLNKLGKPDSDLYMKLPDGDDVISSVSEVQKLISRSSNKYGSATLLAGLARAEAKVTEAKYKYKFRTSQGTGKNKEEREAAALEAAQEEYEDMVYVQAIVEMLESIESSTRIASESARRLLLGAEQYRRADNREQEFAPSLFRDQASWG